MLVAEHFCNALAPMLVTEYDSPSCSTVPGITISVSLPVNLVTLAVFVSSSYENVKLDAGVGVGSGSAANAAVGRSAAIIQRASTALTRRRKRFLYISSPSFQKISVEVRLGFSPLLYWNFLRLQAFFWAFCMILRNF